MFEIIVTVDTNDADYDKTISEISEGDLESIKPLIAAIKAFKSYTVKRSKGMDWTHHHNYPWGDCLREDLGEKSPKELYGDVELFEEFIPYPEHGFHTIESITISPLVKREELL